MFLVVICFAIFLIPNIGCTTTCSDLSNTSINKTVYLSKYGKDIDGCGKNESHPCHTLAYVFHHSYDNDTNLRVLLVGGETEPYDYSAQNFYIKDKITTLSLEPTPGSKHRPIIINKGQITETLFGFPHPPCLYIDNIDFEYLTMVKCSGSSNKTGEISISNSKWSKVQGDRNMTISFLSGAKGEVNYSINVKLTDVLLDSDAMTAVPLVAMVTDPKDGGHWDITVLRTEFSCVGLFMKLNNGSFQLIDSSVTGTVMNQNFFIQLSNFDRFYAKNMTCGDDVCSSGNWGYMKIDHISKVTIVNTSEPFIYNINSNVIQVTNVDYLNVSNNNFSRLYSYSGVLVFSDIQNLIFNRNTITSMTKFTYNNGAFLWLKRINHTLMDFTTFDNVQAPTIKCTDCNAFNMYKTNFTSSYCPINIVGFQNINVDSCHFFNNTAGRGAGMSVNGDGKLVLKNCNFTENKALFMESYYNSGFQAGAIDSVGANIDISNSVFLYNNAETNGTFRITGDHFKTVRLSNVNITTPDKDIPKFATAFEINGPNLITKGLKVVIQASKGDIDIFTTHFNKSLSELMFQCPKNAQVNNAEEIFFSCKHCQKDKYTEQAGSLHYHMHNNTMPYRISESFKCHACPYGGQCTGMEQLSSRPNFWGFVQNEIVKFIQCKSGYCCGVGDKCAGIDSCANGRTGPICGQCHENHYVNFFDSKCIPNEECTHQILTWVIFSVAAVLVFLVVAYFQDPWSLFPCCKLYICKTCKNIDSDTHEGAERESLLTPLLDNDDSHQIADKSYEGTSDARNNKVNKKHERDHHSSNKPKQTTVIFGFIKILFNFYQIKLLITIEEPSRHLHQKYEWIRQILPTVFNLRVTIEDFSTSFCFLLGMDDIWKLFIRYVLLFLVLIVLAVLAILTYHGFNFLFYREKKTRTPEVGLPPDDTFTFDIRCKIFLARIVFIGYTNIVTFLMAMTSWAHVKDDELVLLVKGDTGYFNAWTITCMVFLVLWAAPFPFNVYFTTRWLQNKDITINKFIICFLFPPLSLLLCKQADDETQIDEPKAPYLLSMYEAPFRAKESKEDKRILLWDGVIAFRRFLIAGVCVYVHDYIFRMVTVLPIMLIFCIHNARVMPYKSKWMNHLETVSFFLLSTMVGFNLVWAFFYVYSLPYQNPMSTFSDVVKWIEIGMGLLPFVAFLCYCMGKLFKTLWNKIVTWLDEKLKCKHELL